MFLFSERCPAGLVQAGGITSSSEIRNLIHCICNNEELPQQWEKYILYVPV
jgi:hypothetical protein